MAFKSTITTLPATSGTYASTSQGTYQYQGYSGYTATQQAAAYNVAPRNQNSLRDDYEKWYAEPSPTNRMLLALRSGIDSEISWALERLCRLSCNELFIISSIPGLVDALFQWPEWYLEKYGSKSSSSDRSKSSESKATMSLFAPSSTDERRCRYALESLFTLRNAAVFNQNASDLSVSTKIRALIVRILNELEPTTDESTQLIIYALELLQSLASTYTLPSVKSNNSTSNPTPALEKLAGTSNNRSIIIGALASLNILYGIPQNASHNSDKSPALAACIRYLPLYEDSDLVDACLNFLYAHLSYPPMTRSFLLHPDMSNTLRVLVGYIIRRQGKETGTLNITPPSHTVPAVEVRSVISELTEEEVQKIGVLPEPERCYEWLRTAFEVNANEELTQVEFWNAYKDYFTPFQDRHQLLNASDVIKNASVIYPSAQAMVLQGPPQKFIIRGITKRKKTELVEHNICLWNRSSCNDGPFSSPHELFNHVKSHLDFLAAQGLNDGDGSNLSCKWATCQHSATSHATLVPHVMTHLPRKSNFSNDPSKLPQITLASATETYPITDATTRPPPPDPHTVITFPAPAQDPPSGALTALLIIRLLFRASFASAEAAPRVDADHFGFPGIIEEADEQDAGATFLGEDTEAEREGERRGRRAFLGVRSLLENIHIRDPVLMSWIYEMVDSGSTSNSQ